MANSIVNKEAERWVVSQYLSTHFQDERFEEKKLKLLWGGEFAFDAVNQNGSRVGLVSTSPSKTAKGKLATGPYHKMKGDALNLLHVQGQVSLFMVFTESTLHERFMKEAKNGRFPPNIELLHVPLPEDIQMKLLASRKVASQEVTRMDVAIQRG